VPTCAWSWCWSWSLSLSVFACAAFVFHGMASMSTWKLRVRSSGKTFDITSCGPETTVAQVQKQPLRDFFFELCINSDFRFSVVCLVLSCLGICLVLVFVFALVLSLSLRWFCLCLSLILLCFFAPRPKLWKEIRISLGLEDQSQPLKCNTVKFESSRILLA
jgi:hypothetical protein